MADRESCISRLWTPQHIIHAELGPASQKFSTTLTTPKNRKPGAHSCSASISPLTVITIAEPRLFPVSCCFLRRFSFISQRGSVFIPLTLYLLIILFLGSVVPSFLWLDIFLEIFHVPLTVANAPLPPLPLSLRQPFLQLKWISLITEQLTIPYRLSLWKEQILPPMVHILVEKNACLVFL